MIELTEKANQFANLLGIIFPLQKSLQSSVTISVIYFTFRIFIF